MQQRRGREKAETELERLRDHGEHCRVTQAVIDSKEKDIKDLTEMVGRYVSG
jgi:hypothetical protein